MEKKTASMIDLFCGTGGFSHGFTKDGQFELLYGIDNNADAAQTAAANHRTARIDHADIRKVDIAKLKIELGTDSVDLIVGGPPCQGFSSLRPSRSSNVEDERNNLYLHFARFVEGFRPKIFVMENVVGLLTHQGGATLSIIEELFAGLGYSIDWAVLNAASYGVPQKRERFIMIGAAENGPINFPAPSHSFSGRVIGHRDAERLVKADDDMPPALTVNEAIGDLPRLSRGEQIESYSSPPRNQYQKARRGSCNVLSLHRAANHSDKMMEVIKYAGDSIACIPKHLITSGFSSCYSRLDGMAPATTITVKFQSPASNKCIHPEQHRTITPREAARIQSFDDNFIFCGSYTSIAAQLGNAVPPLLGKAICGAIKRHVA